MQRIGERGRALPGLIGIPLIGAAAMALADVPLKLFGVSDPKVWSAQDWASDAIPHLAYGAVTLRVTSVRPI